MIRDPQLTPEDIKHLYTMLFASEAGRLCLDYWEWMYVREHSVLVHMSERELFITLGKQAFVLDIMNVLDYGVLDSTKELTDATGTRPDPASDAPGFAATDPLRDAYTADDPDT